MAGERGPGGRVMQYEISGVRDDRAKGYHFISAFSRPLDWLEASSRLAAPAGNKLTGARARPMIQ